MKLSPKKIVLVSMFLMCISFYTYAQNVRDSVVFAPMVKVSYGVYLPGGDLSHRFGVNSAVGLNFSIKTKNNLFFGVDGSFVFGNNIKEDGILDSLKTSTGFIINQNGNPAIVRLFERGFTASFHVGKLFPLWSSNKNSGLLIYAGPTYFQHKIAIDDIGRQSAQLVGNYLKGYDRLSSGYGLHEFIGYAYLGNNRMINFFIGLDLVQAFTKSQRSFDYDLMKADIERRLDILSGIRVGWILPLYKRNTQQFHYY